MVRSKVSSSSLPVFDMKSNRLGKGNQNLLSFGLSNEFWENVGFVLKLYGQADSRQFMSILRLEF